MGLLYFSTTKRSSTAFICGFLTLEYGTETSLRNYHYSLRNSPENGSSHLLRGGSMKTLIIPACSDIHKNHRRVPCGQNLETLCAKTSGGVDQVPYGCA